ncbi:MAG: twin-arginine translocase subunit TatC [Pseudomonadota bacterium]
MTKETSTDPEKPLVEHLTELRSCLVKSLIAVVIIFLLLLPFANDIYHFFASPMLEKLPSGSSMIATEVASPFLTPFKLTLFVAVFLAIPFIFFQLWSFVMPGLYETEKKVAIPLLLSSILLFYAGIAFAYFAVFPLLFAFLAATAPEGVQVMTDINHYLNFILKLFFAFGLSFEIPIATILLIKSGFISVERLAANRPYIILGAFVAGMLLTPPDVISQIMLAIPIWFLFELGLILGRKIETTKTDQSVTE